MIYYKEFNRLSNGKALYDIYTIEEFLFFFSRKKYVAFGLLKNECDNLVDELNSNRYKFIKHDFYPDQFGGDCHPSCGACNEKK